MGGVRVRVLGSFEVEGTEPHRLGPRKARTLLKILALARGRPVRVDALVECLWPDEPPARPASQVAVLVSRLRGVLGTERLARSDAGYALACDWLDVDALADLADEAERRLAAGSPALARAAAAAALELVRGPLLADEADAPWAEADRAATERLVARARQAAAEAALDTGAWADAAELGRRALDHDPYDEGALRVVMAALASSGRPASALAAYAEVRARLGDELGVDPSPETEALHTAILLEQPLPGRPAPPAADGARGGGPPAALPGRETEVAALADARRRAASGLELVVVEGEAGIGKSRLLRHWRDRVQAEGGVVLWGACDELGRVLPLQAPLDALRSHLRLLGPDDAASVLGPHAAVLAPLLAASGEDGDGRDWLPVGDASARQVVLFGALLAVLGRLAPGPPVLVLDDVHLADASTLAWLAFAVRRREEAAALVVATRRTGEAAALPQSAVVGVGPLDLAAAGRVVGPERAARLHARTGGNPLLLVELAAAGGHEDEELPGSLVDAVTARCDQAGPAGPTLRTAAVVGPDVDLDLLAAVLSRPPIELLAHLEEGVRRGFLDERGARFAFRHELVREALAAGTPASRRAFVHREAGRALAARASADPLLVAYHAALGGDEDLAATALTRAAGIAFDRHDHAEAERLLDRAVVTRDGPDARLQRARVRLARTRYDAAGEDAAAALAQGGGAPAFELAGWVAYYQRDFARARSLADDGAKLADDARVRAGCLALAGRIRHSQGDVAGADQRLSEAVDLGGGAVLPVSSVWLGWLRVHQGRAAEALDLLRSATRPGPALVHPFAAVHAHTATGQALATTGRAAEALDAFAAAEAEVAAQGAGRFAGRLDNFRSWVLRNLGATEEADELSRRAVEVAERGGLAEALAHGLLDLADGRLVAADLDGAAGFLDRARAMHPEEFVNRWRSDLRARLLAARLALFRGEVDEAAAEAQGVAEDARAVGAARYVVLGRLVEARSRAAAGEPVDLDQVAAALERLDAVAGLEAWWLTAEVAADLGVDRWAATAERRLGLLVGRAGPYAEMLRRAAGARLERTRTSGRRG